MSTFSGEPSFGVGDGFGVGVSVEGGAELGHLFVALDAAEGSFGVKHAGRVPAQHHLAVAPPGDVAVGGRGDGDHRLDRVGRGEPAVDAEARATVNISSKTSRSDAAALG